MSSAALLLPARTLLDGAMGTSLIARGLDPQREPADLWNLLQPDTVLEVHRRFVAAGCQVLQTNSFGASRLRLRSFGREQDVAAINRAAVELARSAAGGARVAGTIGPSGLLPPPEGDADLVELEESFAEQAALLAAGGVDYLVLETFYHPKELRAALRGAREGAPDLAVVGCFTCGPAGTAPARDRSNEAVQIYKTPVGFTTDVMLGVLHEERVDGVGVNCNLLPMAMVPVVAWLRARSQLPLIAKPIVAPEVGAPLLPAEFAAGVVELFAAGATAVGGCCGAGPADLEAARDALA